MSTIVALSDFRGEIVIAQATVSPVSQNVQWFCDKYEAVYLRELLGSDFATMFITGLKNATLVPPVAVDPRWTALLTPNGYDLKTAVANFIYYWYQRDQDSQTMGIGTGQAKAQNAVIVSAAGKVARAWFEMVCISWQTLKYLRDNASTYPEFVMPCWFTSFYLSWITWEFSSDIFNTEFYYSFYRRFRIPDIFINMNQFGI